MSYPLLFEVRVHAYTPGIKNDYGELIEVYTPELDEPGTVRKVFGWAAPTSTEPKLAGHDRVTVDVELIAPPGVCGPHDVVDLPGVGQFNVIGEAEDYNHNPWFQPGLVIFNLRRVEG